MLYLRLTPRLVLSEVCCVKRWNDKVRPYHCFRRLKWLDDECLTDFLDVTGPTSDFGAWPTARDVFYYQVAKVSQLDKLRTLRVNTLTKGYHVKDLCVRPRSLHNYRRDLF